MTDKPSKCPTCQVNLVTREFEGVTVDECPSCGGIWFEKGELEQAKDTADGDLSWLDFKVWKSAAGLSGELTSVNCPACGGRTVILTCGDTGVSVNYCQECQGSWLSKGEFEKLIDSLEEEVNGKTFSEYAQASLKEAREVLANPTSFLSEWKGLSSVVRLMQYRLWVEHPKAIEAIMSVYRAAH